MATEWPAANRVMTYNSAVIDSSVGHFWASSACSNFTSLIRHIYWYIYIYIYTLTKSFHIVRKCVRYIQSVKAFVVKISNLCFLYLLNLQLNPFTASCMEVHRFGTGINSVTHPAEWLGCFKKGDAYAVCWWICPKPSFLWTVFRCVSAGHHRLSMTQSAFWHFDEYNFTERNVFP